LWHFVVIVFSSTRKLTSNSRIFPRRRKNRSNINNNNNNSYLGSWERYAGRNDKRRSREVYNMKANVKRGKDDGVREWLQGFCHFVGHDVAAELLGSSYLTSNTSIVPSVTEAHAAGTQHLVLPDGSVAGRPVVVEAHDVLTSSTTAMDAAAAAAAKRSMKLITDDDDPMMTQ
jgi:hypothetical protein